MWDDEELSVMFDRTNGRCHLCGCRLVFGNYGRHGARGAWHVEHSIPRARGGTDHGNNLRPACIGCNLEKSTQSTRRIRARYGRTAGPYSRDKRDRVRLQNALIGLACTYFAARYLGISDVALLLLLVCAWVAGYKLEPDPQRR
jgi:5-methylcytosine-specific restriction endonuclease McrA